MRREDASKGQLLKELADLGQQRAQLQSSGKERKQNQDIFRENAARLQAILETTVDGIITIDEGATVQSFNQAAERIFGYTAGEVVGRNVNMLMPSPYRENHDTYVANYLNTGKRKIIGKGREVVGKRKDGTTFPLYLAVSEVWVEERRLFAGILRDISDIKQAIEETRSVARFPNESPLPILRVAGDGRLLFANASSRLLLQTWGCEPGQYLPDPWRGFTSESLNSGMNRECEIQCGDTTYSLVFAPALNAEDVNIYGSDITERKRLEDELQKANEELELRVQRRTVQLAMANATLQEYTRKLEFQTKELEEFAHIASHDLQEPLRKIHVFADWISKRYRKTLDQDGQDKLNRLATAANRMRTLVQALLSYSRLTGRAAAFTSVDLKMLVEDVTLELKKHINETGGAVETGELPVIEADPVQMRLLFRNLIDNGLKYRQKESPHIKIYSSEAPGGKCEIFIEDNGIGFDEKFLEIIFKPFQRLHIDKGYDGAGIGLTICRKVVERHEGSITARSVPGRGTTFIVTLPRRQRNRTVCIMDEWSPHEAQSDTRVERRFNNFH